MRYCFFDCETEGFDGKPHTFVGKKVFHPSITFKPFKINLFRVVIFTDEEMDELGKRYKNKVDGFFSNYIVLKEGVDKF